MGAAVFTGNGVAWADIASPGSTAAAAPKGASSATGTARSAAASHGNVLSTRAAHTSAQVQRRSSPGFTTQPKASTLSTTASTRGVATSRAAATPATASGLLTSVVQGLAALTGGNPTAPSDSPFTWTLLAFTRREFSTRTGTFALKSAATTVVSTAPVGPNLLVNSGAELGDPSLSGYSSVTIPGWTVTGTPTVIRYGAARRLPGLFGMEGLTLPSWFDFPHSNSGGAQFFGGGNVGNSSLTQTVDLSAAASEIDNGTVPFTLSGDLGGYLFDPSRASVTVDFLDANQGWLGTRKIAPVTALGRGLQTGLLARDATGTVPIGTRSVKVIVTLTDYNPVIGHYNNAYADNVSFSIGASLPAPPPPTPPVSTVGPLDHVFMVYMENHGVTDIVGSRNAPYLNSLINAYGSAAHYYALTHPSDPNYYPILGGSDFGVNYNCAANCFDQPNLADTIEGAGKTWAAYQDGGGGYSTPTDRTPFLAFSDIYNDPARVAAHIFDLSQMGSDLSSTATAPNFAWFSADEDTNMEGPIDNLGGILQFAFSQLTTHQYNVKAGDQYLQQTLPVIFNSAVWQDPTQTSAIFLTFDEDYNNLSWGIGNQGNHVVMVVIPSPGAVAAGMRGGAFTANDYYNHYSLQRTIEDSLGLPPLTSNDEYAQPMNEFWT
jgi:hypothetical protein